MARNILKHIFFTMYSSITRIICNYNNIDNFNTMLYTIATILLVLWLLGLVTSYTLGGFIHVLLIIAVVVFLIRIIRGEKVL